MFNIHAQDKVIVVGHDRVARDIDGEHARHGHYTFLDPCTAVLVVLTGVVINPAQESPAHAARDHVVPRGVS